MSQALSFYNTPLLSLVDFSQRSFWLCFAWVIANPLLWNIAARNEYRKKTITKLFGNKTYGCYFLAVLIFTAGIGRDWAYSEALKDQPTLVELNTDLVRSVSHVFLVVGLVFVLSSTWALGITGTFLGDYFGILMSKKVEGFPFNILDNPMYVGSTLIFLSTALRTASPAGLLLTLHVFIVYEIASIYFEGPFTSYIYSQAAKKSTSPTRTPTAAGRSLSPSRSLSPARTSSSKSPARSPSSKSPARGSSSSDVGSPARTPSGRKRRELDGKLNGSYWKIK